MGNSRRCERIRGELRREDEEERRGGGRRTARFVSTVNLPGEWKRVLARKRGTARYKKCWSKREEKKKKKKTNYRGQIAPTILNCSSSLSHLGGRIENVGKESDLSSTLNNKTSY